MNDYIKKFLFNHYLKVTGKMSTQGADRVGFVLALSVFVIAIGIAFAIGAMAIK